MSGSDHTKRPDEIISIHPPTYILPAHTSQTASPPAHSGYHRSARSPSRTARRAPPHPAWTASSRFPATGRSKIPGSSGQKTAPISILEQTISVIDGSAEICIDKEHQKLFAQIFPLFFMTSSAPHTSGEILADLKIFLLLP